MAALRLVILLLTLGIVFKQKFRYRASRYMCGLAGGILMVASFYAAISQPTIDALADYIKVFDFILFGETGLVLLLAALTIKAGSKWRPSIKIIHPRLANRANKPA